MIPKGICSGLDWDDQLPLGINSVWCQWKRELETLESVRVPWALMVTPRDQVRHYELHIFDDASEAAYGAVAYVMMESLDGAKEVRFCLAKTRVAPVKRLSLPRLELIAALLAARLKAPPGNPADKVRCGRALDTLRGNQLWWNCPAWLKEPAEQWPRLTIALSPEETRLASPERKKSPVAGPLSVKDEQRPPQKVYICLFTCMVTRALHLEMVLGLTTISFLAALRPFIARRGRPNLLHGKSAEKIREELAMRQIEWRYSTDRAPWCAGYWERLVSSVKNALRKVLGKELLRSWDLHTVLCELEARINDRPLSLLNDDPHDCAPWDRKQRKSVMVKVPSTVHNYNMHMGGVDLNNMLSGLYRVSHKSRNWTKAVFLGYCNGSDKRMAALSKRRGRRKERTVEEAAEPSMSTGARSMPPVVQDAQKDKLASLPIPAASASAAMNTSGLRKRWRNQQLLMKHPWNRWLEEYLETLTSRGKWTKIGRQPEKGELVFLVEEGVPRNRCNLGVITEPLTESDRVTRSVKVRVARPSRSLILLEPTSVRLTNRIRYRNRRLAVVVTARRRYVISDHQRRNNARTGHDHRPPPWRPLPSMSYKNVGLICRYNFTVAVTLVSVCRPANKVHVREEELSNENDFYNWIARETEINANSFGALPILTKANYLLVVGNLSSKKLEKDKEKVESVVSAALSDSDEWIRALGDTLKHFLDASSGNFSDDGIPNLAAEFYRDIRDTIIKKTEETTAYLAPEENPTQNIRGYSYCLPLRSEINFVLKRRSKAAAQRASCLEKAAIAVRKQCHKTAVANLANSGTASASSSYFGNILAKSNSLLGRVPTKSLEDIKLKTASSRRDSGIKVLELEETPQHLKIERKEQERKRKEAEKLAKEEQKKLKAKERQEKQLNKAKLKQIKKEQTNIVCSIESDSTTQPKPNNPPGIDSTENA
ncbi:hypothetical protein T09_3036 [Trichinella sp. T9]|nr:hypothetical protein T09_3036 [Trichinella sp. T9]